jgi:hypothetical protein
MAEYMRSGGVYDLTNIAKINFDYKCTHPIDDGEQQ